MISVLPLVVGCATVPGAQPSVMASAESENTRPARPGNHITAAELQGVEAKTTLDAVRRLHPEFLRGSSRAPSLTETPSPSVYVNRTLVGDASWLAMIPIEEIKDIEFLHPVEARMRFGSGCQCGGGVLVVQTERLP
jgi:hypothetical protein